ncbi:MAG: NAD(P)H-dependent oxidoreductase subunit E [Candidatus Lustribacter sp.]|jgi:NADH-quinone oxidoreductase subunit E
MIDHEDELVADWVPYVSRPGNAFDELYAKLKPECEALIGLYEDSRSALIPMAHLFQEHEGWTSPNALAAIAYQLKLPLAVVESTISFYTLFYRRPVGRYMLQVCRNLSCMLNGAEEIMAYFREQLGIGHLQTTDDGLFSYEEVECLAACDRAPCMQVNLRFKYDLTPKMVDDMLAAMRTGTYDVKPRPQTKAPARSWKVEAESGRKSAGGTGVSNPDNAGGVGDRSGVIMLDRIVNDPAFAARSRERLAHEPQLRPSTGDGGHH